MNKRSRMKVWKALSILVLAFALIENASAETSVFRRPVGRYDAGRPFPWMLDTGFSFAEMQGYWTNVNGPELQVMKIEVVSEAVTRISQIHPFSQTTIFSRELNGDPNRNLISIRRTDEEGIEWRFRLRPYRLQRQCGLLRAIFVSTQGVRNKEVVHTENYLFKRIFDLNFKDVEQPAEDCSPPMRSSSSRQSRTGTR